MHVFHEVYVKWIVYTNIHVTACKHNRAGTQIHLINIIQFTILDIYAGLNTKCAYIRTKSVNFRNVTRTLSGLWLYMSTVYSGKKFT